jgi:hypothetical protein
MDHGEIAVQFPAEDRHFSLLLNIDIVSESHPASYSVGTGALSPGVMRPEREADHLSPSTAEVTKSGATHLFPLGLHGVHGDNINFTFYLAGNTVCVHYKDQSINAVHGNNHGVLLESQNYLNIRHVGKMQTCQILKNVVHITTVFKGLMPGCHFGHPLSD